MTFDLAQDVPAAKTSHAHIHKTQQTDSEIENTFLTELLGRFIKTAFLRYRKSITSSF